MPTPNIVHNELSRSRDTAVVKEKEGVLALDCRCEKHNLWMVQNFGNTRTALLWVLGRQACPPSPL